jgi:UDP-2,4-diacetamido-2,4,6-trideoxy-beta-L-altropyranose hydrolase
MNIVFRTDGSLQIGTGHVMRCLTLAEGLRAGGNQCHFICRELPGNLIAQITQRSFTVSVLPVPAESSSTNEPAAETKSNYADWLVVDWATDAQQTKNNMGTTAIDWLIVDHYAIDKRWEEALRPVCQKLMVIDDLADRQHDCDLLLDQNLGRHVAHYNQLVPDACTVLAGSDYVLLRPEFAAQRYDSLHRRATPKLKHLLITMGGVDQMDATGKVLEALQSCQLPADMRITVVMGAYAPWLERVQLLAKEMMQPTEVKVNVKNMAQLMTNSDFAICAAGTTTWEVSCLGLPALLVVVAENQADSAAYIAEKDAAFIIDILEIKTKLFGIFIQLNKNNEILRRLTDLAKSITDGTGCNRVIKRIILDEG